MSKASLLPVKREASVAGGVQRSALALASLALAATRYTSAMGERGRQPRNFDVRGSAVAGGAAAVGIDGDGRDLRGEEA